MTKPSTVGRKASCLAGLRRTPPEKDDRAGAYAGGAYVPTFFVGMYAPLSAP
jgi:hypothetical protein